MRGHCFYCHFGVVSFGGPIGSGIAGVYFVGNTATLAITGQTISEHFDDKFYTIPVGLPGLPAILIPK
jgi:hypothetical protein